MDESAGSPSSSAGQVRRAVRPNFAEDVYGPTAHDPSHRSDSNTGGELSESSLAQRRSAHLLKLKDIRGGDAAHKDSDRDGQTDLGDLEFAYGDCDDFGNELSELYSYSEMEEFAANAQAFRNFADSSEVGAPFSDLPRAQQSLLITSLCSRLESAVVDDRLSAARALLYVLQGAFMDFDEDDDMQIGKEPTSETRPIDRGTGNLESDCLNRAVKNAYLAAECGAYDALVTMLMHEIDEPFDVAPQDGRESKASSIHSAGRNSSTADLAENERRARRSATTADNEAMRVVLAALYHLVEAIRREELIDSISDTVEARDHLRQVRADFLDELESPLPSCASPLIVILCDMMTPFYNGFAPHYPVKKVFLLTWKVILATFGGWDVLREQKIVKRDEAGLPSMEDTLEVARNMKACAISEGDGVLGGGRGFLRRNVPGRMLGRQMACTGAESEEGTESAEESDASALSIPLNDSTSEVPSTADLLEEGVATPTPTSSVSPSLSAEDSGERTPTAGSPTGRRPLQKILPWKSKVRTEDLETFVQHTRNKFFRYELPGDTTTLFGLPPPIHASVAVLRKHVYVSLAELQVKNEEDYNRYIFSVKEKIELTKVERLFRQLLPTLPNYVIALLKVLLAAAPSNKAKSETVNILCDLLTPEMDCSDVLSSSMSLDKSGSHALEDSMRLAIDVNRHKEIVVKAVSGIIILLLKHFKLNHVFQFESIAQQLIYGNAIPLMLKYLDQNMVRYVQSRHEIHAYNYPQCALFWARNREEWPTLSMDNVELAASGDGYRMWRNVFSSVNMVRILNKLTKWKHARTMMLVVFKSAPILKRCLKIKVGLFQLYVLKLLKMQARYLGRQWRRSNMDIISAIYCVVRHRLADDWAFANDTRSKSWDFQADETALKSLIERFHSRRYSKLYPAFAIEVNEAVLPGDNYLNHVDRRDFEPVDNCAFSLLGQPAELGDKFKKNYSAWLEREVFRGGIDWDRVLIECRGVMIDS